MPIRYASTVKLARLAATRDQLNGGALELLTATGVPLARIELDKPCAELASDALRFSGMPKYSVALASGAAGSARIVGADYITRADGLTVGVKDADVLLDNLELRRENIVRLDSMQIRHAP